MAKTKIYTNAKAAAILERISAAESSGIPFRVLSVKQEKDDMREVLLKYNDPQDLFLLGMLTANEWAKDVKKAMMQGVKP